MYNPIGKLGNLIMLVFCGRYIVYNPNNTLLSIMSEILLLMYILLIVFYSL